MIEAMSAINAFASLPTAVGPWNCIVRCGSHQLSAALAAHRRSLTIDAAVQSAAATVLLQEGVEGGDQLGHRGGLLDHLIRPLQERRGDRQAEGFGGLEVDNQLEL